MWADASAPRRADRAIVGARLLGTLGFFVTAALLSLSDGRPLAELENSDFLWDYYVAGRLLLTHQVKTIYALGSPAPWPPAFSAAAHALFPGLPQHLTYPFVYPPVMVVLIAPFTLLPPRASILLWQALSVVAVGGAARVFSKLPGARAGAIDPFLFAFAMLFLGELLIMGQAGVILGLLPLTAGYVLWQRERHFAAGLAWSVLTIKIQLAFPVVLVGLAVGVAGLRAGRAGLREPLRIAAGMALGGAVLAVLPLPFMGLESYRDWLVDLHAFNANLADPNGINYAPYLIGSVPELLSTAHGARGQALAGAFSAASAVVTAIALIVIARRPGDATERRDVMMAIALAALPLIAPYLRLYDDCSLTLAAWIVLYRLPRERRAWRVGVPLIAVGLVLFNVLFLRTWFAFATPG